MYAAPAVPVLAFLSQAYVEPGADEGALLDGLHIEHPAVVCAYDKRTVLDLAEISYQFLDINMP